MPDLQTPIESRLSFSLHRYAQATAAATFLLLIAGSLVTSNDAGLAVPDWPLSYGTWFPPMVGGILYEHGHRLIAGIVAGMILVLAVWLAKREPRPWVRRLGLAAFLAVVMQALLGGLTVLLLLSPQVSISHACLGQTVFCLTVCVSCATAANWQENPPIWQAPPAGFRFQGVLVAFCAALQLVLGAVVRHTGQAVAWHVAAAGMLVSVCAAYAFRSWKAAAPAALRARAMQLFLLILVQLAVGISVFFYRRWLPLRTLHVAIGALVLSQSVILAWETLRRAPRNGA